ncbi:MAG TPA: response regulator [Geminicoccus sp.]|uniref:response regulator n=1 Tax=Geminicoccus sp. TaxID=2024832 RepID=UPI002B8A13D3|nr:response regulator [Geminicoccus sp.]HWL71341.1 response regulator [Geminicoccus sp.]
MPDRAGSHAPSPAPTVLVVEDEFLLAMELEAIILAQGWQVLGPVTSVEEALDLLDTRLPDVAVLDVNLRGVMVTPVAEALERQNIPFVLATAYQPSRLQGSAVLAGAVSIGKPIGERRLVQAILQVMATGNRA